MTRSNGIEVLGSGLDWNNLDYLSELPALVSYALLGFGPHNLGSLRGIENQFELKSIILDVGARESMIDWMKFPKLKNLYMENQFVNSSVWSTNIESLEINNCSEVGWENFSRIKSLMVLKIIAGGMRNMQGLQLDHLKELQIHRNKNFSDIGNNVDLASIEKVVISKCIKLNSLENFSQFVSLKELVIGDCGTIDSLAPLLSLRNLEKVYFYGTRVSDGKFRAVSKLPAMKRFLFGERQQRGFDISQLEVLQNLDVPKKEWPLELVNPNLWRRITHR